MANLYTVPDKLKETSKCFIIKQHYAKMGAVLDFSWERIYRLCEALQLKPVELGAIIRVSPAEVRSWMNGKPPHPSVALHLLFIEKSAFGDLSLGSAISPFPENLFERDD